MEIFDDNSEGKRSIHLSKTVLLNFGHMIWRKNLNFLYNNCMLLFYLL